MTSPIYLTAIWPGDDEARHRETIERHFVIKLRAGESSYYASTIYRWRPKQGGWRWLRPAEPDGIAEITLHRNCDGLEDVPIIDGQSTDDWVVRVTALETVAAVRDFLAEHGNLVDE